MMTARKSDQHHEKRLEEATAWFVRMQGSPDLLTEADWRAFHHWLEEDPAHRSAYAEAEALWGELGDIPDPRPGGARAIHRHGSEAKGQVEPWERLERRPRPAWGYGAVAACFLLVTVLGFWITGAYDRLRADYATGVGETHLVALDDGSRLHLNTDTVAAVEYTADRRRIRLYRGELFAEVAHDRSRPFEVIAGGATARALGTAFNVRRGADGVTIAVAEGRVQVSSGSGREAPAGRVTLGQGQAARFDGGGSLAVQDIDVAALTAWRDHKLVFADRPLRDVVAELDRYRPGAILLLDDALAEMRFTGVLDLRNPDQALAAIERTLSIDAIHLTGYLTFLRTRH